MSPFVWVQKAGTITIRFGIFIMLTPSMVLPLPIISFTAIESWIMYKQSLFHTFIRHLPLIAIFVEGDLCSIKYTLICLHFDQLHALEERTYSTYSSTQMQDHKTSLYLHRISSSDIFTKIIISIRIFSKDVSRTPTLYMINVLLSIYRPKVLTLRKSVICFWYFRTITSSSYLSSNYIKYLY